MTVCPGAAVLMSRHSASAASSSERTLTRAEIFFEKIRVHPAAHNATNWLSSSWPWWNRVRDRSGAAAPVMARRVGTRAGRAPREGRTVWSWAATWP